MTSTLGYSINVGKTIDGDSWLTSLRKMSTNRACENIEKEDVEKTCRVFMTGWRMSLIL
jgi:hypothetical protein